MKKALFIDRDGTVIAEPPADYQVDSLEKLEFIPGAISALRTLRGLDFELVMATNQDGLGTEAFPEEDFRPPHEKMLRTLAGEGVAFDDMLIDRTFESDDAPTRKPRTGMFGRYTDGSYARDELRRRRPGDRHPAGAQPRGEGHPFGACRRRTQDAAGSGRGRGMRAHHGLVGRDRGIHPPRGTAGRRDARNARNADHRTHRPRRPGLRYLRGRPRRRDFHRAAVPGSHADPDRPPRRGVAHGGGARRPGHRRAPHDGRRGDRAGRGHRPRPGVEGGHRPLRLRTADGRLPGAGTARLRGAHRLRMGRRIPPRAGRDVPTEMFRHFFHSLCCAARCNLQISARGGNDHHKAEAIFKAFARALRMAVARTGFGYDIPSSKGIL